MKLTNYFEPKKKQISLKTAYNLMRSKWQQGTVSNFERKLCRILDCDKKTAEEVRLHWESLGFLVYDKRGLLTWKGAF